MFRMRLKQRNVRSMFATESKMQETRSAFEAPRYTLTISSRIRVFMLSKVLIVAYWVPRSPGAWLSFWTTVASLMVCTFILIHLCLRGQMLPELCPPECFPSFHHLLSFSSLLVSTSRHHEAADIICLACGLVTCKQQRHSHTSYPTTSSQRSSRVGEGVVQR